MLRLLLGIPALVLALIWDLLSPERAQPAPPASLPPLPDPNAPDAESVREGHELSDAKAHVVGWYVVGLFTVIFGSMAALGWMYERLYTAGDAMPVKPLQTSFKNAPRSQTSIAQDWQSIDALAHQRLDAYGWTDRAHGVVHVPIARALTLLAQAGLPARAAQTPRFPPPSQEKLPLAELESTSDATKPAPH